MSKSGKINLAIAIALIGQQLTMTMPRMLNNLLHQRKALQFEGVSFYVLDSFLSVGSVFCPKAAIVHSSLEALPVNDGGTGLIILLP